MNLPECRLKKNGDRRLRAGHVWIYSNEIASPLHNFKSGDTVNIVSASGVNLGTATFNPHTLLAGRLISQAPNTHLDEAFFLPRIQAALRFRDSLFQKPFYRLVFGESDGLPGVVIDRYGQHLVVQLNTAGMDRAQKSLIETLKKVFPDTQSILLRNDNSYRQHEGLSTESIFAWGQPPKTVQIEENGFMFTVLLTDGQKTGWFYDHRLNRARLKEYVKGKRVLDIFSYLGAFGIHAAGYGAESVVCVDSSALSAEGIMHNAKLNHVQDKVSVLTTDAFEALKDLQRSGQTFDVIILDPPAFAKKQKDVSAALIAYQRLNAAALKLLSPSGLLMTCSCSMQVSFPEFQNMLHRAAWQKGNPIGHTHFIERGHQGPDHPVHPAITETDYLKMVMMRKEPF